VQGNSKDQCKPSHNRLKDSCLEVVVGDEHGNPKKIEFLGEKFKLTLDDFAIFLFREISHKLEDEMHQEHNQQSNTDRDTPSNIFFLLRGVSVFKNDSHLMIVSMIYYFFIVCYFISS